MPTTASVPLSKRSSAQACFDLERASQLPPAGRASSKAKHAPETEAYGIEQLRAAQPPSRCTPGASPPSWITAAAPACSAPRATCGWPAGRSGWSATPAPATPPRTSPWAAGGPPRPRERWPSPRHGVTILTGFLGSGKTTLLNRILKEHHGQRIAVIENEFGEAGIDNDLLVQDRDEQIVEMNNGCICCTVRGDLVRILGDLRPSAQAGEIWFDRVIIETTGLADPAPVAQTFFVDDEIGEHYLLDAIVTVVDAKHGLAAARRAQRGAGAGGLCRPHPAVQDRPGRRSRMPWHQLRQRWCR
jgi:Ni2+-binding GTPase involved in maturation of urease and hydrogenase